MGVGAVFVSTLALTRLPTPQLPPRNQQEFLAATLQTIVSFVVLGSILIRMLFPSARCLHYLRVIVADGLSIPFFSFGRRIHSRTVSMSRTWTSRNTTIPDWLLGARRVPADGTIAHISASGTMSAADIERGADGATKDIVHPPAVHYAPARDADVLVIPQSEAEHTHAAHLGVAAMLEDPAEESRSPAEASAGRWAASVEDVGVISPSDITGHVRVRLAHTLSSADADSRQQNEGGADTGGGREGNADLAAHLASKLHIPNERPSSGILARRAVVDDEDGEHLPSGLQTPTKMVRFPSDQ